MRDTVFFRQAELLLRILPLVHKEEAFALKGGTAINFFVQDLPRLSVDIDLTYLPLHERDFALDDIRKGLARIAEAIEGRMPGARILQKKIHGTDVVRGLIVERDGITVKVEANLVLRGSVYPAETKTLSKRAQDLFELSLQMRILSPHDLYAGKICAALDRQHPRDLFDVHLLFRTRGLDPQTRKAFLVYLVSHPRPMVEILDPQEKDIQELFEKEFKGMITEPVTWEDLAATREKLVSMMGEGLNAEERRFIVSVKEGRPEWGLLGLEGVENLPGVKWKLLNISRMDRAKHRQAVRKLRDYLGV